MDWRATKQKCISTSTMEAEYVAMSTAAKEAAWVSSFVKELGLDVWIKTPYAIWCDNRSAIDFARNRIERSRTKHIDVAYHYVKEMIDGNSIVLKYVATKRNAADVLTKSLNKNLHRRRHEEIQSKPHGEIIKWGIEIELLFPPLGRGGGSEHYLRLSGRS